jgi:glutamate racemase
MIEAGKLDSPKMELALRKYLGPLIHKNIDTLILGCTHYGILEKKIRKIIGPEIKIVSEARVVPNKLKQYLKKHGDIEKTLSKRSGVCFYSTDRTHNFKFLGSKLFGKTIQVKKATLR